MYFQSSSSTFSAVTEYEILKRMKPLHILFDLDGTLTDPKVGILNSVCYAVAKMGREEHSKHELVRFIGPPLRESFMLRYDLSLEQGNTAVEYYREYYSAKGVFENRVYDGIPELLECLHLAGHPIYLASSKPTVFCEQILLHFGLRHYFREVVGSNLDNTRTDKSEIIAEVLSLHSLQSSSCVMIGDRMHDIIGARVHGIPTIAVSYGYGSVGELSEHKAEEIAHSPSDVLELLSTIKQSLLDTKK